MIKNNVWYSAQVLYENYYSKKVNTKQEKIYEKSSHGRPPARPVPFERKRSTKEGPPAQTRPTEQGQAGFIQPDRNNEPLISPKDNGKHVRSIIIMSPIIQFMCMRLKHGNKGQNNILKG